MADPEREGIYAVVTFKAEILVDIPNGLAAEETARQYLALHPEILRMTMLSCEKSKIRRLKRQQGGAFKGGCAVG